MRGDRLTICCVLSTSAFVKSVPEILAPPRSLLHVSAQHHLLSTQPDAMLCGLVEHCMFCDWNRAIQKYKEYKCSMIEMSMPGSVPVPSQS